ncbi:MAG TPA: hypothetical protein VFN50_04160 [Acidimicrobiales bacterium]|nr:hypothetical protein [Acidimicrobiales bacterium]
MAPPAADDGGSRRIELLQVPVALWARADDEAQDLMREFAVIVLNRDRVASDVPARLLELIKELQASYGPVGEAQAARLEQARAEEQPSIERLSYEVPAGIGDDVRRLAEMLDEADEYCRSGQLLLSLATSPGAKAFRDWFFDEFHRQLDGEEPTPWPSSRFATQIREAVSE